VAWAPQHPHLFHGTVAENLRLAKPGASWEAILDAARAAHAHEFIERLPLGYDTPIGERGARLSGGQQQRIAIARAFLKDAPFLILDEATSQLDAANEDLLRDALARLMQNRTVLIIAHRLKLAYDAELVAVMDGGRVIQQGSPLTLVGERGVYRNLVAVYERSAS
jgi:ATP-binding cassette subfamily C protein CydD